jgi:hypothetical protein
MKLAIEIKSASIDERTITTKEGKKFEIREQSAWVDLGKAYPQEIDVALEPGAPAYSVGQYELDPACLYVDRFGKLKLGRIRLAKKGA